MILPGGYVRDLLRGVPGATVTARGWVKTRRDGKNVHFIQLNDGSSPADLQVVVDEGVVPAEVVARITTGACLSVEGELVASPGKGQAVELKARTLVVHGTANPEEYPLQKKKHNLETLRPLGHLRGAQQHVRRGVPRAQRIGAGHSQILSGPRLPLRAHAHHFGFRRGRRGLHVPGDRARSG